MSDLSASLRALNAQLITRLRAAETAKTEAEAAKSHAEEHLKKEIVARTAAETKLIHMNPMSYSSIETGDTNLTRRQVTISESSVSVRGEDKNWLITTLANVWQYLIDMFNTLLDIIRGNRREDTHPIP